MNKGQRRVLWCYLCIPLSSACFLWSRHPRVRFHAWQACMLGLWYIVMLSSVSVVEILFGVVHPALSRMLGYVAPTVAAVTLLLWLYCVVRIMRRGDCALPLLGRWSAQRVNR